MQDYNTLIRTFPAVIGANVFYGAEPMVPYQAVTPGNVTLPALITIDGIDEPPPGELVLALRRKPRILDLFRAVSVFQARVEATRAPAAASG